MGEPRSALRFVGLDSVALVDLVRAGDADAYGELYTRYHDFAHKVARRSSGRHADDLVAESFRRVLTAISRGAGPTQAFGPYLAATIRSAAAGLAAPYQEVELEVSHLLADEQGDVDPRVSSAYLSLPEQWQNALWYADVEGMSPRHAAPLLGMASANAFSALRQRARAGLRSAYLTQVVDEACNEHVRRHLQMLMAGATTAVVVDDLVDEHLRDCDVCAAIGWRVAAVTGNKVGVILAPALLAFHGFAISGALLPAGFGLSGLLVWFRGLPKSVAVVGTTATVGGLAVATIAIGSMLGGSVEPSPRADAVVPPVTVVTSDPDGDRASAVASTATTSSFDLADRTEPPVTVSVSTTSAATTTVATTDPSTTESATSTSTTAGDSTTDTSTAVTTTTIARLGRVGGTVEPTATVTTSSSAIPSPRTTSPATSSPGTAPVATIASTTSTSSTTTTSTTSSTSSTSTTTTSTSTTSTTVAPVAPGRMVIAFDGTIGSGSDARRFVRLEVVDLTGAPGTITFSRPIEPVAAVDLVCSATGCTLGAQPGFVMFRSEVGPLTIRLRDGTGAVTASIVLP